MINRLLFSLSLANSDCCPANQLICRLTKVQMEPRIFWASLSFSRSGRWWKKLKGRFPACWSSSERREEKKASVTEGQKVTSGSWKDDNDGEKNIAARGRESALPDICGFRIWRWSQAIIYVFKTSLFVSMETYKSNIPSDCRNMAAHHWAHLRSGNRAWRQLGLNQSAYLYSSSCSLTAEMTTAGTSAMIKTKRKRRGRWAGCRDESAAFCVLLDPGIWKMTGAAGTKGNIHYLFLTHVRVEKWSLWRTSAALTLLKIEQEGGGRGGGTQVRGRTDLGGISQKLSTNKTQRPSVQRCFQGYFEAAATVFVV